MTLDLVMTEEEKAAKEAERLAELSKMNAMSPEERAAYIKAKREVEDARVRAELKAQAIAARDKDGGHQQCEAEAKDRLSAPPVASARS